MHGAPEGRVDHGHARYCIQRGMHHEQRCAVGAGSWLGFDVGFSVWRPGDEQRFDWRSGGRSQFLFIAPEQVQAVLGDTQSLPGLGQHTALRSPMLDLLFDALQTDLAQGSPAGPLVGDSLIAALVAHLAGGKAEPASRREALACNRAIELIHARFAHPISLQELAEAAGLSTRHFTRAFRQATGMSPYQYVLQRRVEASRVLIAKGLPLADVAVQCGFADQSQLNRIFVRHTGTTPGRYRRGLPQ
ncbi:MAG TPA: AraC family transcriptional regulator [Ramlibacter sp.]|nr:AraC family transcriptional regulator [Ramlibacter sp.]